MNNALFLDRDGTLVEDTHYLYKAEDIRILVGVPQALRLALQKGYHLFLFTNQSGIARGYYTLQDAEACNTEIIRRLGLGPNPFTATCIAQEAPWETTGYRKPSPKFIQEMIPAHNLSPLGCWMVGDNLCDLQAGKKANIHPVYLQCGKTLADETHQYIQQHAIPQYPTLLDFVQTLQP
jgi:D-glycero-D-manno-heptose 1,7-bisphosphate phosphatase